MNLIEEGHTLEQGVASASSCRVLGLILSILVLCSCRIYQIPRILLDSAMSGIPKNKPHFADASTLVLSGGPVATCFSADNPIRFREDSPAVDFASRHAYKLQVSILVIVVLQPFARTKVYGLQSCLIKGNTPGR